MEIEDTWPFSQESNSSLNQERDESDRHTNTLFPDDLL